MVVKSFDALDLGGVFRTFFGVDVVLAALEPDLMKRQNGDNSLFFLMVDFPTIVKMIDAYEWG